MIEETKTIVNMPYNFVDYVSNLIKTDDKLNCLDWSFMPGETENLDILKGFYGDSTKAVIAVTPCSIHLHRVAPKGCRIAKKGRIVAGFNEYEQSKLYTSFYNSRYYEITGYVPSLFQKSKTEEDLKRSIHYIIDWHLTASKLSDKIKFNAAMGKPALGTHVLKEQ